MSEREYNRFLGGLRLVALFAVIAVLVYFARPTVISVAIGFDGLAGLPRLTLGQRQSQLGRNGLFWLMAGNVRLDHAPRNVEALARSRLTHRLTVPVTRILPSAVLTVSSCPAKPGPVCKRISPA